MVNRLGNSSSHQLDRSPILTNAGLELKTLYSVHHTTESLVYLELI